MVDNKKLAIYEERQIIDKSLTDNGYLSLYNMGHVYERVAGKHAEILGLGRDTVIKENVVWVIVRQRFEVISLPKENDEVIFRTYPYPSKGTEFYRHYDVLSLDGKLLIKGDALFVLMDIEKGSLCRGKFNYIEGFEFVSDELPSFERLKKDIYEMHDTYEVIESDIDINNHMNNAKYMNVFDKVFNINSIDYKSITIYYHNQLLLHQVMNIKYHYEDNKIYILCEYNDKVIVSALIERK